MIIIGKKQEKPLLEREEIYATSDNPVTPSISNVQEELSTLLKKDKELIVVKGVYPSFGKQEARIVAYVYESKRALDKFETKKKEKKKEEKKS